MKIGVLSDAHGNEVGLNLCVQFFIELNVEKVFFLGDIVGYFPEPGKAIKLLKSAQAHCLLGDHDAMLLGYLELDEKKDKVYKIKEVKRVISQQEIQEMSVFLPWLQIEICGRRILLIHGSPWDPLSGYIYPDSDLQQFSKLPFDIIFMGQTHRPFIQRTGTVTVVNVGSCGLPRDQGNLASCAIYDTKGGKCEIFRIPFNAQSLIEYYENRIHNSVVDCLLRKSKTKITGRIIKS